MRCSFSGCSLKNWHLASPDYGGRLTSATMKVAFGSVFNEERRDESEKCRFLLTMLLLVSSGVSVPAANAVENEGGGTSSSF